MARSGMIRIASFVPLPAIVSGLRRHRRAIAEIPQERAELNDAFERWARWHVWWRVWTAPLILIAIVLLPLSYIVQWTHDGIDKFCDGLGWLRDKVNDPRIESIEAYNAIAGKRGYANAGKIISLKDNVDEPV